MGCRLDVADRIRDDIENCTLSLLSCMYIHEAFAKFPGAYVGGNEHPSFFTHPSDNSDFS